MILNGKLHMIKLQKQVSNRIFHKEEKERERSYICTVLGKCAKIDFPSQNKCNIAATKTVLTRMKIQYFHEHTGILTEPMRHQNLYILYGDTFIKALYHVFEYKCSKVIRNQKPGLGLCLSYKILRNLLLRQQYHALDLTSGPKVVIFQGRCTSPQKLNIIKFSLSLFLVKYSVSNLFLVLVHMQLLSFGFI